jgi:hypothetical protein
MPRSFDDGGAGLETFAEVRESVRADAGGRDEPHHGHRDGGDGEEASVESPE